MEDTLGDLFLMSNDACWLVLILVLMEDTLGVVFFLVVLLLISCLNPCSNGRYSRRVRGVKALFQAGGE